MIQEHLELSSQEGGVVSFEKLRNESASFGEGFQSDVPTRQRAAGTGRTGLCHGTQ